MTVADLARSVNFYCDVFSCRVALHEQDTALLQAHFPSTKGFKPQGMSIRSCPYAICE